MSQKVTLSYSRPTRPEVRRLEIPNLIAHTQTPDAVFGKFWPVLSGTLAKILAGDNCSVDYHETYCIVEYICKTNNHEILYNHIRELIDKNLDENLGENIGNGEEIANEDDAKNNGEKMAHALKKFWRPFMNNSDELAKLCFCLDCSYVNNQNALSVVKYAHAALSKRISKNNVAILSIVDFCLTQLKHLRNNQDCALEVLNSMVNMLVELKLYNRYFESEFFEKTTEFYSNSLNTYLHKPISEFLGVVTKNIEFEEKVISKYVSPASLIRLNQIVRWECFGKHLESNLIQGIFGLLDEPNLDHLKLIYSLSMQVVNGEETLVNIIKCYIKNRLTEIFGHASGANYNKPAIIEKILIIHDRLFGPVSNSFNDDINISKQMTSQFNASLNQEPTTYSQCLSEYIDFKMRKMNNKFDENVFNNFISQMKFLLKSIYNRESFLQKYRMNLADRLIDRKCSFVDCEKLLVEEVKKEIGTEFISKIDGMFRDVYSSQEFSKNFNMTHKQEGFESNLMLLSSGFWPTYNTPSVNLPEKIGTQVKLYDSYYHTLNKSNRELCWPFQLGHCIVQVDYVNGVKEFELRFFETLVLTSFEETNSLMIEDMIKKLGIVAQEYESEIFNAIQSLACGNYKILIKIPAGIKVSLTDVVQLNTQFKDPSFRIKIPKFFSPEIPSEIVKTVQPEYFDRDIQIEALIVFWTKQHKSLPIEELRRLVKSRAKLEITDEQIENRIDNLSTREYVRRNAENRDIIEYFE